MFHQRLCSEDALGGKVYYQRLCDEAAGGHAGCDSQCGNGAAAGYAGQRTAVGLQLDSMGGGGLHAAT